MSTSLAIGVLALQGGVAEHLAHFRQLGVTAMPVRSIEELNQVGGLVVPGGESTCLSRLLRQTGLDREIVRRANDGLALWGTCAGAILLADELVGEPAHLRLIKATVARNAFGPQIDSFQTTAHIPEVSTLPQPLIFIRAPKIVRVDTNVQILLELEVGIAAARQNRVLITTFHPELTPSLEFHRYFADMALGVSPALPTPSGLVWPRLA